MKGLAIACWERCQDWEEEEDLGPLNGSRQEQNGCDALRVPARFQLGQDRGHVRQNGYGKGVELEMVSWLCKQVSQSVRIGPGHGGHWAPEDSDASPRGQRRGRLCWCQRSQGWLMMN